MNESILKTRKIKIQTDTNTQKQLSKLYLFFYKTKPIFSVDLSLVGGREDKVCKSNALNVLNIQPKTMQENKKNLFRETHRVEIYKKKLV